METKLNINAIPDGSIGKDKFTEEVSNILDYINDKQEIIDNINTVINTETERAEKAETFLTPVPNTYWELIDVGKKSKPNTNRQYESIIIPVREGDRIIVTAQGAGYARTWGVLDENKYVLRHSGDTYPLTNEEVIIATGEYYIVVNGKQVLTWDVRITSTAADILQQFIAVEDRATAKGRQLALRDLFIAAGAEYNDGNEIIKRKFTFPSFRQGEIEFREIDHLPKHYYLNGLGDITEEQMLNIYSNAPKWTHGVQAYAGCATQRTFFFKGNWSSMSESFTGVFMSCAKMETLCYTSIYSSGFGSTFSGTSLLKWILPAKTSYNFLYGYKGILESTFRLSKEHPLEEIRIYRLRESAHFENCPNLSKNSVRYMINESEVEKSVTDKNVQIILHPDAYAKFYNDEDILVDLDKKNNGYTDENGNEIQGLPEGFSINLVSA